jgi:hypothetical protein
MRQSAQAEGSPDALRFRRRSLTARAPSSLPIGESAQWQSTLLEAFPNGNSAGTLARTKILIDATDDDWLENRGGAAAVADRKSVGKSARRVAALTAKRAQLRIELRWVEPLVWRRILVPETVTLAKLHAILQRTMGWTNSHLHEFEIERRRYGIRNPEWDFGAPVGDERRARLQSFLDAGVRRFTYRYDFGDDWEHLVKVEDLLPPDPDSTLIACTGGENACPPEDVGGPPGYAEFLAALADPTHEEHEDMRRWIGYPFDPAAFDRNALNQLLARIRL